jgi:hypothetical protein
MINITTPCPSCGKRKKIRTRCELTKDYLRVTVRNGCYSCGWQPAQRHFFESRRPARTTNFMRP